MNCNHANYLNCGRGITQDQYAKEIQSTNVHYNNGEFLPGFGIFPSQQQFRYTFAQEPGNICPRCNTLLPAGEECDCCAPMISQPEEGVSVPQQPQNQAQSQPEEGVSAPQQPQNFARPQLTDEQLLRNPGRPKKSPGDPKAKYTPRGQKTKAAKRSKQGRPKGSKDGPGGRAPKGEGIKSLRKAARERAAVAASAANQPDHDEVVMSSPAPQSSPLSSSQSSQSQSPPLDEFNRHDFVFDTDSVSDTDFVSELFRLGISSG
ncbi:unnamed protein product [Periconia digitata]|uniref:Uncharacterized protein n=1 Tax=Periconia digitata TaxID=1303443 RepID=A0A9W4XFK3_9PLEO|nr:unnamed protein product [Periconia digitata]